MSEIVISLHDIKKRYGMNRVLKGVDIDIEKGDIYGIIGKNGSGKTTIFKIILGLSDFQDGTLHIGAEEDSIKEGRRKIGYYIGSHFYPFMTGKQNLKYYCKSKGIRARGEVNRVLDLVGLKGVKGKVSTYSLGMKNRLGIATAILGNPEILILDEPTNGLDPKGIADIRNLLKDINKKYGTTIVISSHILSELQNTADHFAILDDGVIKTILAQDDLQVESEFEYLKLKTKDIAMAQEVLEHVGIEVLEIKKEKVSLEDYYFDALDGKLPTPAPTKKEEEAKAEEVIVEEVSVEETAPEVTSEEPLEESSSQDAASAPSILEVEEMLNVLEAAKVADESQEEMGGNEDGQND